MDYGRIIEEAERRHGLTPGLLASVWEQESNRSTDLNKQGMELSRNRGRARGPFQIVPYYHPEADFGSFESQADYAAKYLADVGLEGYYGTGTPPPGHPTPEQYRDQVMSRVSDPSPPPVGMSPSNAAAMTPPPSGMSPGDFEALQEAPQMQNMTTPPQMGGFSLPGTVPLDLSPIEDKFQPSLVDTLVSNPFLMMGLGILGTGNIGEGALKGLGAAAKGQESSRKARQFGIEQERMRRYQQLLENQNRVSEMKLHGAGAASPDALLRQRAAEMTHQRGVEENRINNERLLLDQQKAGMGGTARTKAQQEKEEEDRELFQSMNEGMILYDTLDKNPDFAGVPGKFWKAVSATGGQITDAFNGIFGTNFKGGETAAEIAAFETKASSFTSQNARDIINQGDPRMSDSDRKLADELGSLTWADPSAAGKASIRGLTELRWRRYLLNRGVPKSVVYNSDGSPTLVGIPPQFRPQTSTPPEMTHSPPQAGVETVNFEDYAP